MAGLEGKCRGVGIIQSKEKVETRHTGQDREVKFVDGPRAGRAVAWL